jgi:uncharacterized membrane protein
MKLHRGEIFALALVVAAFVVTGTLYSRLPEKIPSHWNIRGEVDSYTSKPFGPFVLPAVMAVLALILLVLPAVSPRGFRFERFRGIWGILQAAVLALLLYVHAMILFSTIGKPVDMTRGVEAGFGLLLAVVGNFFGKLTRNFFVGIRTPWTLASDEVWMKTHRLAGKLFVLAGLAMFALALAGAGLIPMMIVAGAAALVSVVASYVFYRRIEGFKEEIPGP